MAGPNACRQPSEARSGPWSQPGSPARSRRTQASEARHAPYRAVGVVGRRPGRARRRRSKLSTAVLGGTTGADLDARKHQRARLKIGGRCHPGVRGSGTTLPGGLCPHWGAGGGLGEGAPVYADPRIWGLACLLNGRLTLDHPSDCEQENNSQARAGAHTSKAVGVTLSRVEPHCSFVNPYGSIAAAAIFRSAGAGAVVYCGRTNILVTE